MTRALVRCQEWKTTESVPLTVGERDALSTLVPSLRISPSRHSSDRYDLTPGSTVGTIQVGEVTIEIEPKIGPAKVIALASLAFNPSSWREPSTAMSTNDGLTEAMCRALTELTRRALRSGLLQGYRTTLEVLPTVRGRVRFADQVQQRRGMPLPVAVTYDDYTHDTLEHQLLLAAARRLSQMPLRSAKAREDLMWLRHQLDGVSDILVPPVHVPEPVWTRLNERYRPAVTLARLILAGTSLESGLGGHRALAFLVDMNQVFEDFIRVGLRERLRLTQRTFPDGNHVPRLFLDESGRWVPLKPDLSWWNAERSTCLFVGDCKYKRPDSSIPNADVYQLHAYVTALQLPAGLLIYARTEGSPSSFQVAHGGPRIEVRHVDLAAPLGDIDDQLNEITQQVRTMAEQPLPAHA